MLESLAYDYALGLAYIRELFPNSEGGEVLTTGGGAKSGLWNQIKADVLGLPYRRLGEQQFALRGCGIIAGYGLGVHKDMAEIARGYEGEKEVLTPIPKNQRIYEGYRRMYRELFTADLRRTFANLYAKNLEF
jgi:xylulokinase